MTEMNSIERDRIRRRQYVEMVTSHLSQTRSLCDQCQVPVYQTHGYSGFPVILDITPLSRTSGYIACKTDERFHVKFVHNGKTDQDLKRYPPHTCRDPRHD